MVAMSSNCALYKIYIWGGCGDVGCLFLFFFGGVGVSVEKGEVIKLVN